MLINDYFVFYVFAAVIFSAIIAEFKTSSADKPLSFYVYWSLFWVAISLFFGCYLVLYRNFEYANLFFSAYLLEKSLSIDNLFVFSAVFSYYSLPLKSMRYVLSLGVFGAIFFRGLFLTIGYQIFALSEIVEFLFGILIACIACSMFFKKEDFCYQDGKLYKFLSRIFVVWPKAEGLKLLLTNQDVEKKLTQPENSYLVHLKNKAKYYPTSLLICLFSIEFIDILFALDSTPVVLGVSRDPLIIFSSTFFAILGLRSFYFLLDHLRSSLKYLDRLIFFLMMFVATKMLINGSSHFIGHDFNISNKASFLFLITSLLCGVAFEALGRRGSN